MKKIILGLCSVLLLLILFVIGWLSTATISGVIGGIQNRNQAEVTIENPTITFIGDSLTNGYYSYEGLQTDSYGYRQIVTEKTNATAYNFAVGGYTSEDVLEQINTDVTLASVNQTILEKERDKPELKSIYTTDEVITISEAVIESDYVISTIGANDVLQELLIFNEDGSFTINKDGFFKGLEQIHERKYNIYSQIHEINPDVHIIDIGMYMAYPHFSDFFTSLMYPVLMYAEHQIFISDSYINTTKITVRDNIQSDIKSYIDNPTDIHPNQEGYEVMANEVLKEMERVTD